MHDTTATVRKRNHDIGNHGSPFSRILRVLFGAASEHLNLLLHSRSGFPAGDTEFAFIAMRVAAPTGSSLGIRDSSILGR